MERLQAKVPEIEIAKIDPSLIEGKEALIFALLGLLRYLEIPNSLSSVTGASRDSCNGAIYI